MVYFVKKFLDQHRIGNVSVRSTRNHKKICIKKEMLGYAQDVIYKLHHPTYEIIEWDSEI